MFYQRTQRFVFVTVDNFRDGFSKLCFSSVLSSFFLFQPTDEYSIERIDEFFSRTWKRKRKQVRSKQKKIEMLAAPASRRLQN